MYKMYVIVREDMPKVYAAVQGGHALAQWMLDHPEESKEWSNGHLIYVKVANIDKLKELVQAMSIQAAYKNHSIFWEPDLKWEMTAVALVTYGDNPILRDLPLL